MCNSRRVRCMTADLRGGDRLHGGIHTPIDILKAMPSALIGRRLNRLPFSGNRRCSMHWGTTARCVAGCTMFPSAPMNRSPSTGFRESLFTWRGIPMPHPIGRMERPPSIHCSRRRRWSLRASLRLCLMFERHGMTALAETFQCGLALANHTSLMRRREVVDWGDETPVIASSVHMLEIPAAPEIAPALEMVNRARRLALRQSERRPPDSRRSTRCTHLAKTKPWPRSMSISHY